MSKKNLHHQTVSHNTVHNRRQLKHIKRTSNFIMIAPLALAAFVAYKGTQFFASERYRTQVLISVGARAISPASVLITNDNEPGASSGSSSGSVTFNKGGSAQQSTGTNQVSAQQHSPSTQLVDQIASTKCGNTAIPQGACEAMMSIEQSGAKNNEFVAVDTSQLPEGTKIRFDKSSWSLSSESQATISATGSFLIKKVQMHVTFSFKNNKWLVTAYSQA